MPRHYYVKIGPNPTRECVDGVIGSYGLLRS
jgi:hypothetical protein